MSTNRIQKDGLLKLLQIKDSDIRLISLKQGFEAVDKGIHSGGAFSAVIPLVSLYYGGTMNYRVEEPTAADQDMFVLSKGHAVAAMASIYADLGYFSKDVLVNSRSRESILNGHPGPVLPGVHIPTGPLGQGCCTAQGFALAGAQDDAYDVYSLLGDGELQEGVAWEAIMHAGHAKLDNLCFMVDRNRGQLDRSDMMILPMDRLEQQFAAFGWKVISVDGQQYEPVVDALREFKEAPRDGRPTVIICNTRKGFGAFSSFLNNHKITLKADIMEHETAQQQLLRDKREADFFKLLERCGDDQDICDSLLAAAGRMNLTIDAKKRKAEPIAAGVKTRSASPRDKRIAYDADQLPKLDPGKSYVASDLIKESMKVIARDPRIVSVDADLASTSGLQDGVGYVDQNRAVNVGVAEANMMAIGEAFACLGYQAWISTFCPFFDLKVLRRIAVGQQERIEVIGEQGSWLAEGHGLDLVMLATAANIDTKTNGATHMGNDDIKIMREVGQVRVIDVSCPNQLMGILRWLSEGGRGLVYLRIMRADSPVIYPEVVEFEYGKGYYAREADDPQVVFVSSGRGVFEALDAAELLEKDHRIGASVIDMPSPDKELLEKLYDSGKTVIFAEQNNGYLWSEFKEHTWNRERKGTVCVGVNTSYDDGSCQYIHSAMYEELLDQFGLDPKQLAALAAERSKS